MQRKKRIKKDEIGRDWLFIIVFFLFSIICTVLGVLCLGNFRKAIFVRYFPLWASGYALFVLIFCCICVWCTLLGKRSFVKTALSFYLLLLFCEILLLILLETGFFQVFQSPQLLQEYLARAGIWMPFFYILLQYLQVVILPIPSVVSTLAGIALFGPLKTTIYSLVGIVLGSFTAFFIGRKLGFKAVSWAIGEDTLKKWQKKLKGKDNLFLSFAFLLPLFPDDLLCFLAGLSSMSWGYFTFIILLSRFLGVAGTCYSVDLIPFNTWWGICLWIFFFIGVIFVCIFVSKNTEKIQKFLRKFRRNKRDK